MLVEKSAIIDLTERFYAFFVNLNRTHKPAQKSLKSIITI